MSADAGQQRGSPAILDAERSLLGAVLEKPESFSAVHEVVKAKRFAFEAHRLIFAAMEDLAARGAPIDRVTLKCGLFEKRLLERAGGEDYIDQLTLFVPAADNVMFYARLVANPPREPGEDDGDEDDRLDVGVASFLATCNAQTKYLLEPFIPARALVLLQGPPKAGKTWMAAWLAVECARRGFKVAFVEEESSREVLRDRLKPFIGPDPKALEDRLRIIFKKRIRLDKEKVLTSLIEACRGFDLIVLDPFVRLHGKREKEQDEMGGVMAAIQRLMAETGAAVVLVHHTRKGESWKKSSKADASIEDARGSGVLAGEVDNIIAVRGVPPSQRRPGEVRLVVENPDTRIGSPFAKRTAVIDLGGGNNAMTWTDATAEEPESVEQLLERVVAVVPMALAAITREKLRDALRVKKDRMREAVDLGLKRGLLIEGRKGLSRPIGPPTEADPDPDP